MNNTVERLLKVFLTLLVSLLIGTIFIVMIHQSPIEAYKALIQGAFDGRLRIGTTLANFTPLLLTSIAFAFAAQAGAFNVGVEGEIFLGGIVAAYIGINWTFLPTPLLYLACFAGAVIMGAAWAWIPGALKAYYNVSEVCTTILMNTIALYITSYLVNGPMSAGIANPQSENVTVRLKQFMRPSSVNVGIFIAIITAILIVLLFYKTSFGFKLKTVGSNPKFSDCMGIDSKKVFIQAMMISGGIGGLVGCIEVLGVHGYFLDNFASNLGINGMLAALIVKSNMIFCPILAMFLAILRTGALRMQQATGVPKSLVDTITAIFIIFATMDSLFNFNILKKFYKKRTNKLKAKEQA
jgi:simple sugar transport system permease protein